jgi:hypothetical protein
MENKNNPPSGWGQGDDIPLWEFEGNAPAKRLWGTLFPTPLTKEQSPFEPLQDGVKGMTSPCRVQGQRPCKAFVGNVVPHAPYKGAKPL